MILLSLAATARDIYAAPALLGAALLIALHISESHRPGRHEGRDHLLWTRRLVATVAGVFAAILVALGIGGMTSSSPDLAHPTIALGECFGAAVVMLVLVWGTLRQAASLQRRGQLLRGFQWTYAAYAVIFCVTSLAVFPTIDRWQDLPRLAQEIHFDTEHRDLALLNPDETTVAMLDWRLRTPVTVLTADETSPRRAISNWFAAQGGRARVLVLLPGHATGELTPLLQRLHRDGVAGDGLAGELETDGVTSIVRRYELPHGRRYALLAPRKF